MTFKDIMSDSDLDRFWVKVDKSLGPDKCWPWTASVQGFGYGQFILHGKNYRSHRISYELLIGKIPSGLHLDHLCRVRRCCNPIHLDPVTPAENTRRGISGQNMIDFAAQSTACRRGHPYAEYMVIVGKDKERECRLCRNMATARYYKRKKERERGGQKLD